MFYWWVSHYFNFNQGMTIKVIVFLFFFYLGVLQNYLSLLLWIHTRFNVFLGRKASNLQRWSVSSQVHPVSPFSLPNFHTSPFYYILFPPHDSMNPAESRCLILSEDRPLYINNAHQSCNLVTKGTFPWRLPLHDKKHWVQSYIWFPLTGRNASLLTLRLD